MRRESRFATPTSTRRRARLRSPCNAGVSGHGGLVGARAGSTRALREADWARSLPHAPSSLSEEAAKWCVVSSCGVLHVLFVEQVLNDLRLLLAAEEMSAHGGHHLGAIPRPTLAKGVRFDVLIQ